MKKLLLYLLFVIPFFGISQVILQEDFEGGDIPSTWTVT